jgi:hypothetical protein
LPSPRRERQELPRAIEDPDLLWTMIEHEDLSIGPLDDPPDVGEHRRFARLAANAEILDQLPLWELGRFGTGKGRKEDEAGRECPHRIPACDR